MIALTGKRAFVTGGTRGIGRATATLLARAGAAVAVTSRTQGGDLGDAATARDQTLASVEALFNDGAGTGLGSALNDVFASFSALATNPNDTTTRAFLASPTPLPEPALMVNSR